MFAAWQSSRWWRRRGYWGEIFMDSMRSISRACCMEWKADMWWGHINLLPINTDRDCPKTDH